VSIGRALASITNSVAVTLPVNTPFATNKLPLCKSNKEPSLTLLSPFSSFIASPFSSIKERNLYFLSLTI
jgi:hypothetical protein